MVVVHSYSVMAVLFQLGTFGQLMVVMAGFLLRCDAHSCNFDAVKKLHRTRGTDEAWRHTTVTCNIMYHDLACDENTYIVG